MKTKIKKPTKRLILLTTVSFVFLIATVNGQWTKHYIDENLDGATDVVVADINNDNTPDVVASGYYAYDVVWYENPSWTKTTIDWDLQGVRDIAVADLDGDSDLDVAAVGNFQGASQIAWYEAPDWTKHTVAGNSGDNIYSRLAVADINEDDVPDIISADNDNGRVVWFEGPSFPFGILVNNLDNAYDIVAADMDGDDVIDLVVNGLWNNYILWLEAPLWTQHIITDDFEDVNLFTVADMNNDGNPDVVAASNTENAVVWYESPDWTMHYIDNNKNNSGGITVADLNDDENPDVIIAGGNDNDLIWYEAPSWTKHAIDDNLNRAGSVQAADMDDDNDLDIVVVAGGAANDVVWYENHLITGIESFEKKNSSFGLSNNYPNPFSQNTTISFNIHNHRFVSLKVYDVLGNEIKTLVNKELLAGEYEFKFSGKGLTCGIYYYQLRMGNLMKTKKMILMN